MRELSVNVDHVASLRQARREGFPDPVEFALLAEKSGADGITCHLRSDRRHIHDDDVRRLKSSISGELNVEMAATEEMMSIVLDLKPHQICLVPENLQEVTTEGGLNLKTRFNYLKPFAERIVDSGIRLSIFIEAEREMIQRAVDLGAERVEFNMDSYARALEDRSEIIKLIADMAQFAEFKKIESHIGHALDYDNISPLMEIREIKGASIGFAIVARALRVGFEEAVREMAALMGK